MKCSPGSQAPAPQRFKKCVIVMRQLSSRPPLSPGPVSVWLYIKHFCRATHNSLGHPWVLPVRPPSLLPNKAHFGSGLCKWLSSLSVISLFFSSSFVSRASHQVCLTSQGQYVSQNFLDSCYKDLGQGSVSASQLAAGLWAHGNCGWREAVHQLGGGSTHL